MTLLDQRMNVEKALRAYRATLKAGVYFFIGRVRNGELLGIEEVAMPQDAPGLSGNSDGIVFGFMERGRAGQGPDVSSESHPLVHHIQATSPQFMKMLEDHLAERLRSE